MNLADAGKAHILRRTDAVRFRRRTFSENERSEFRQKEAAMKTLMTSLLVAAGMLLGSTAQAEDTAAASSPAVQNEAAAPAPTQQTPKAKPVKALKLLPGVPRPRDMDLRHCLELPTNAEIAACAGE